MLNIVLVINIASCANATNSIWCELCSREKNELSPVNRGKLGKHHLITEQKGIPLAIILTGANTHDVTQLLSLVEAIPAIAGKRGRP